MGASEQSPINNDNVKLGMRATYFFIYFYFFILASNHDNVNGVRHESYFFLFILFFNSSEQS